MFLPPKDALLVEAQGLGEMSPHVEDFLLFVGFL